ncbi:hypothetical protein T484DRAFT_1781234 [Baffinella frigidus]|nr:hypothetical protein T484DRAFT_1781234 [Cryptophyta sp. CCMP2293]
MPSALCHTLPAEGGVAGEDAGLFLTLSRVNHDCCPNAARVVHKGGLRLIARSHS